MPLNYKIKEVYPEANYTILCKFENGKKKRYKISNLIEKYPVFLDLKKNQKIFNEVKVDIGGYGVSWNEEIDLASEEIWENGEEV